MASLINKVKDAVSGESHTHSSSMGQDTAGPREPIMGNTDDPRTYRDLDSSGDIGVRASDNYGTSRTGPHHSAMANKFDPHIDSNLDGRSGLATGHSVAPGMQRNVDYDTAGNSMGSSGAPTARYDTSSTGLGRDSSLGTDNYGTDSYDTSPTSRYSSDMTSGYRSSGLETSATTGRTMRDDDFDSSGTFRTDAKDGYPATTMSGARGSEMGESRYGSGLGSADTTSAYGSRHSGGSSGLDGGEAEDAYGSRGAERSTQDAYDSRGTGRSTSDDPPDESSGHHGHHHQHSGTSHSKSSMLGAGGAGALGGAGIGSAMSGAGTGSAMSSGVGSAMTGGSGMTGSGAGLSSGMSKGMGGLQSMGHKAPGKGNHSSDQTQDTGRSSYGSAPKTSGPHKSDIMNKLDPRVDSDLDGSKIIGGNRTYG